MHDITSFRIPVFLLLIVMVIAKLPFEARAPPTRMKPSTTLNMAQFSVVFVYINIEIAFLILYPQVLVTDFGAVGDGVFDNTASFQNALNSVSTYEQIFYFYLFLFILL